MRKVLTALLVPSFLCATATASYPMDHAPIMAGMGNIAHEEVVEGVKATFKIISMKERMNEMNMEMPKGIKETHHLMIEFKDANSGKNLSDGEAKVKILGPDKSEQVKDLMRMPAMSGMGAGFGTDLAMEKKGRYGIMVRFRLKDGKVRITKFWYEVK